MESGEGGSLCRQSKRAREEDAVVMRTEPRNSGPINEEHVNNIIAAVIGSFEKKRNEPDLQKQLEESKAEIHTLKDEIKIKEEKWESDKESFGNIRGMLSSNLNDLRETHHRLLKEHSDVKLEKLRLIEEIARLNRERGELDCYSTKLPLEVLEVICINSIDQVKKLLSVLPNQANRPGSN